MNQSSQSSDTTKYAVGSTFLKPSSAITWTSTIKGYYMGSNIRYFKYTFVLETTGILYFSISGFSSSGTASDTVVDTQNIYYIYSN